MPNPDVLIHVPLPNLELSEIEVDRVSAEFRRKNISLGIQGVTPYPISESWVMIVMGFVAGVAATHYAEMLFDALDTFIKKQFRKFNLSIQRGEEGGCLQGCHAR
jgi:hypothetical protein